MTEQAPEQKKGLKLNIQVIKVVATVSTIVMLFSGLNIYTGKLKAEAQIRQIEQRFEIKDPLYMRQALSSCQANLGDREAVRACVQGHKHQMLAPLKVELQKQTIQGYLWWLFWGAVIAFIYHKSSKSFSLPQVWEVFKTLFNRFIGNKALTILKKLKP